MKNSHIRKVTAIAEVFSKGLKCTGAAVEYDCSISPDSVQPDCFSVEGRTVTGAYVSAEPDGEAGEGCYVMLAFSPDDPGAQLYQRGDMMSKRPAYIEDAKLSVRQIRAVRAAGGQELVSSETVLSSGTVTRVADDFVSGQFQGLSYNLFIPKDYDPEKEYPLVQFIHDADVCGDDVHCTLAQGPGALVFASEEWQKEHPCFVLAPQFKMPTIVDDEWNVDHRLETAKQLLDRIVSLYSINRERIYTTGQSMGCMSSLVLNLRYPDYFAASLFVSGQWDERLFAGSGLEHKNFWFITSVGDAKAFPGMNQILVALEHDGAAVEREIWETGWSQDTYAERVRNLTQSGANMFFTPFDITTVANGWHSHGGEHHMDSFHYAYEIRALREWLFAQSLKSRTARGSWRGVRGA